MQTLWTSSEAEPPAESGSAAAPEAEKAAEAPAEETKTSEEIHFVYA